MLTPVLPGVTPGSGPDHRGLFGLDPISFNIGRGISEALGIGLVPAPTNVLVRGNFCRLLLTAELTKPTDICEQRLALLRDIRVQ